jgi:hypothetical protein
MKLRFSNKSDSTARESVEVKVQRGLVPSGITPTALIAIKNKVGITTSTPPQEGGSGGIGIGTGGFDQPTWLMGSGIWSDNGVWFDNASWTD